MKKSFDSRCRVVRVKVVLKDTSARKNGAKMHVVCKYSHAHPRIKLWKRCL